MLTLVGMMDWLHRSMERPRVGLFWIDNCWGQTGSSDQGLVLIPYMGIAALT